MKGLGEEPVSHKKAVSLGKLTRERDNDACLVSESEVRDGKETGVSNPAQRLSGRRDKPMKKWLRGRTKCS